MYITGEAVTRRIAEIAKEADARSGHTVSYEEYIAIPYVGQIILRFNLNRETFTPDDLDRYEQMLAEIAGDEFLVDFMGSVYRKAGVDFASVWDRLADMRETYAGETIPPSVHSSGIAADVKTLLNLAGIDENRQAWEIQVDGDEYTLLLFGEEGKTLARLEEPLKLTVAETRQAHCEGLIRATAYCRRNGISLVRILLQE